jgi:hypothetical protein
VFGDGVPDCAAEAGPGVFRFLGAVWEEGSGCCEGEDGEEFGLGVGWEGDVWDAGGVEEIGARGGGYEDCGEVGYLRIFVSCVN